MTTSLVALARSHVEPTARLLAAAFDDDPAYTFLFPDASTRARGLTDFFSGNLETHLPYACTFVTEDAGDVVATVTLRPPSGVPISAGTMIRRGLLPFATSHGLRAVQRLFALKATYDRLEREASQGRRHWHVHMMVLAPGMQGRGLGSTLLAEVLRRETAREASPVVLTTHKQKNVAFYRRHGFKVASERDVTPRAKARAYRVWSLARA